MKRVKQGYRRDGIKNKGLRGSGCKEVGCEEWCILRKERSKVRRKVRKGVL